MTRREQIIWRRLHALREEVRSGGTEMVGRTYRDASGKVAGRHRSGFVAAFPEVSRAGLYPGQAAAAIERGKGKRFRRLWKSTEAVLDRSGDLPKERKQYRGRLTVDPHAGTRRCRKCKAMHSKGEHRFHGPGSFHSTHAFSFGRNPVKKNPSRSVVVYGRVLRIDAQKTQPHVCDAECKRYGHRYTHEFKAGVVMYGLPDGSLLLKKGR